MALPLVALAQGMQGNNGQGRGQGNMFNNRQRLQMHNCTSDAVPGDLSDEVIEAMTRGIMDEYNAYRR